MGDDGTYYQKYSAEVQITTSIERTIIPDRNVVGMIEGAGIWQTRLHGQR